MTPPNMPAGGSDIEQWLAAGVREHQAGRLHEAERLYKRVLGVEPRHADGLHLLGVLSLQAGRADAAVELIGRAIGIDDRQPGYHNNLAAALHALGRFDEAAAACRRVIALDPANIQAQGRLSSLLMALGQLDQAADACRRLIQLQPASAMAHNNLGAVLERQGLMEAAAGCFRRAVELKPDFAGAHNNLGGALQSLGRLGEAVESYRRAISVEPGYAQAHNDLGAVLQVMGRRDEAIACYRRAADLNPDRADIQLNLGVALQVAAKPEAAAACFRRAVELEPQNVEAHMNLGAAMMALGQPAKAAGCFQRVVELDPARADVDSDRLLCLNYAEMSPEALLAEHRAWAARHETPLAPSAPAYANGTDPDRRLRIGYVSGDFNFSPGGIFLTKVLATHDPGAVEVFCYANNVRNDSTTQRLREYAHHWRDIARVADSDAAAMISQDGIDILIDLSGHTALNRLLLFARRPAPLQASWLGYPGTTGLAGIDYLLMDAAAMPAGAERFCTEAVARLPRGRFCYTAPDYAPDVIASRPDGPITFGSFNNIIKVGPEVARLWSEVLAATPGSRLVLKWEGLDEQAMHDRVANLFAEAGLDLSRLELRGHAPHREMLAEYGGIDIGLDPFPFCGGLTSCEALWMGVPLVTLPGDRVASRQTLGFLTVLGLDDLVAASKADYVRIAAALAADPARRAELRRTLRARIQGSALGDGRLFTPTLEGAFRWMWRERCAGRPAQTFDVLLG
ncbi:MAG TPA: tetratricopeptide repeat protein [Caulobacterales bacterium]|nr:tetratricopeptide repeat protein [Caulobacterales bacterium]